MRSEVTEVCVLLDGPSLACSRKDVDYAIAPTVRGDRDSDDCCGGLSCFGGWTFTAGASGRNLVRGARRPGLGVSVARLAVLVYFAYFGAKRVLVHTASRGSGDTRSIVGSSGFKLANYG